MKKIASALALALIASAITIAPVAAGDVKPAWHVTPSDCESVAKGKIHEPYEDPFARIVIRNNLTCKGSVTVPDERWAEGTTFSVGNKTAGRGETIRLKAGCYVGTWSNSQEEEQFCIANTQGPVKVAWLFTGKNGPTTRIYTVPEGCSFRSGYKWVKGSTWIKLRNRTDKTLLIPLPGEKTKLKASPPGFYKAFDYDFEKGMSCNQG
jgi:hypothetical protein